MRNALQLDAMVTFRL